MTVWWCYGVQSTAWWGGEIGRYGSKGVQPPYFGVWWLFGGEGKWKGVREWRGIDVMNCSGFYDDLVGDLLIFVLI